ncbi:hypothetical protein V8D89_001397 [Ganoderma adspersum]
MAPHKALLIPDVLHEIFKHLAPCPQLSLPDENMGIFEFPEDFNQTDSRDTYKTRRLALACAARTCRAFTNPASRVLWEVLDEIEPLLSVLRSTQVSHSCNTVLDAAGWARFEDVCRRIRALSFTARPSAAVGDMLSLIFNSHHHDGASFKFQLPNLRALSVWWEVWDDEDPDPGIASLLLKAFGTLCASPSLVLLCLPAITEDHLEVLETIAAACTPRLLHLRVPDVRDLHTVTDADRILGPFTSLQTVTFGRIDRETLLLLGSLPKLRTLTGAFSIDPVDNHAIVDTRRALFPALQELTTSDRDHDVHFPAMLSDLMSSAHLNSLTVLTLRIRTESPEGMLRYLNEAFSPSLSPALASLHELNMSIELNPLPLFAVGLPMGWHSLDNRTSSHSSSASPRGSRTSRSSSSSRRSLATSFDVCDDDLDMVAATWPDLVSLKVLHANWASGSRGTLTKRPSLSALVALAERCRSLESVDVEFDSVGADELARLEARASRCSASGPWGTSTVPQSQTALRRIVVDISGRPRSEYDGRDLEYHKRLRIAEPSRLAAALRTLFPNLRGGLGPEEQERMHMSAAKRRRYSGCRWPWGPARDAEAEMDALRLLKALNAYGVHPRRAATNTALPRKTLLTVAVVGVLVAVMVARLARVQHSGPDDPGSAACDGVTMAL